MVRCYAGAAILILVAILAPAPAVAFTHSWSHAYGGGLQCEGAAVDSLGNIIVIGEYGEAVDFGGGPLPIPDLYPNGTYSSPSSPPQGRSSGARASGGMTFRPPDSSASIPRRIS
jgi:hypothetical protein